MGRAYSLMSCTFSGARVAGTLTYVPAHISKGKEVNSRCVIPIYCNSNKGTDQRTGEKGRSDSFKLVAWGKLADTCCKSLPVGKALDAITKPQSYMGRLFDMNGQQRNDVAGAGIMAEKTSFVIMEINFGEESTKTIAEEIQTGRRPINWDKPNHPDFEVWRTVLKNRQMSVWDGVSPAFWFARVSIPQGQGVSLIKVAPAQNTAAWQNQNLPGLVENVLNGQQPLFDPMTGRPLTQNRPLFDAMTGQPLAASGFPDTQAVPTPTAEVVENLAMNVAVSSQKMF